MNKPMIQWRALAIGFIWVLPAATYAAPGTLATQPLWLKDAVKHNVMFGVDDSGSMDFELLTTASDGVVWLDTNGSYVDSSNKLNNSGGKTVYLFPNGANTAAYNGKKWLDANGSSSSHFAVPPIKNYAFSRSPAYNKGYYDPSVTYEPWPSYGGHTFSNASVAATQFEAYSGFTGGGTLNLFQDLDTSSKGAEWGFTIRNANMVCDESGHKGADCGGTAPFEKHYTYYPATYYLVQDSGTYTYVPPPSGSPDSTNSVLLEAESGDASSPFDDNIDLEIISSLSTIDSHLTVAKESASNERFIGSLENFAINSTASPNFTQGSYSIEFEMPGSSASSTSIWFRVYAYDSAHDSFWVNLKGYGSTEITANTATWFSDSSSNQWNRFNTGSSPGNWHWVKWGDLELDPGSHLLSLMLRESGTYVDQIMVTTTSYTPSGIEDALPTIATTVARDCATDPDPSHYNDFVQNPGSYVGVDAIGLDGACLKKFTITGTDTDAYTNGSSVTRTVLQEKQNFANWFTYYRRRHQALRGALAESLYGVTGLNIGIYWIHSLASAITMRNIDVSADLNAFLTANYGTVPLAGGTPLRTALKYAGDQYMRTSSPVITKECQKNFSLLFTDGFNTETTVSGINNEDASAGAPYQDTYSATLGDVAYKYYTSNLRPALTTGKVDVPNACSVTPLDKSLDCNKNLHMNTYTVGLGAKGTIFGQTHDEVSDAYTTTPAWPDVSTAGNALQIDDLYHAAVNGKGEAFSADSPDQLKTSLADAIAQIISTIGTGSGVTFNTASLKADSNIFTTVFNSQGWIGDLQARSLDSVTGEVADDIEWSAAEELDDRNLVSDPRTILTFNGSDGVAFSWSNLTSAMQDDLKVAPNGVAETTTDFPLAQKRLSYLRGEITGKDEGFRVRESLLGDLINSKPLFVGTPSSAWPSTNPFGIDGNRHTSEFKNSTLTNGGARDRTSVVYVGGNDGMLHGFNANASSADAGKELLAYVPSFLASTTTTSGLHYLTDPDYKHRYYVDLDPVMQDVYIKTSSSATTRDWATILVGGAGAGGRGIFALDVTNPADFSATSSAPASTVLWEFDSGDDDDMGYITEPPLIAMMENDKWAVIFGNGYESTNGVAKLMILFIEEGLDGSWATTGDYLEISTGVGTSSDKNGLSAVAGIDTGKNSKVDRIYAGDLKGNMWAFNVSSASTGDWEVAYKQGSTPKPLFIAKDSSNAVQPITKAPNAVNHVAEKTGGAPNQLVMFGTGQYVVDGDVASTQKQTIYTVWDHGTRDLTRTNLVERDLSLDTNKVSISSTGSAITWNNKDGWYADLDALSSTSTGGERITQRPVFRLDKGLGVMAFFSTNAPSTDACAQGGKSALYCLPVDNGLNAGRSVCDLNQDGSFTDADKKGGTVLNLLVSEVSLLGDKVYFNETINESGELNSSTKTVDSDIQSDSNNSRTGRLGWHELVDED